MDPVARALTPPCSGLSPPPSPGLATAPRAKAVSLADVQYAEFSSKARATAAIHALARPARIGEVDAFVSHSWGDDPLRKWAELQVPPPPSLSPSRTPSHVTTSP
jgi:hypothetical protein